MNNTFHILFIILLSSLTGAFSQDTVPTVVVTPDDDDLTPIETYSTFKVEEVSKEKFSQPTRQSVADVVKDQAGVEAQTYCSNCGAKRLTINGLKGEHTSILIDDLPLHSAVSSFYGVDSIPVNGITDIEVMRGAGASQTNPEAIGGTLNLITVDPLVKQQIYSTSISIDDQFNRTAQNHSALISIPKKDKSLGVTIGGQFTDSKPWDEDKNNVAEAPFRRNYSALFKTRFLPNARNDFRFRFGLSNLLVLGGAVDAERPSIVRPIPAQESDFIDGNVEKDFIGDPQQITDWIALKRYEGAINYTNHFSQSLTLDWNTGFARQEQAAIYQHGFDYAHNDNLFVTDLSLQYLLSSKSILKSGIFYKLQRLRSASATLFDDRNIPKDNFDHSSLAGYLKYSYLPSDNFEINLALRLDQTKVDWLELSNEVSDFILAPRFQLRHDITDHLSQRFSYGLGYRSPLTFFESQHGNNENGYVVDITDLEKAHSLVYSLSFNTPRFYTTLGTHYTSLENMAYGVETASSPISYENSQETYRILATDLLLGLKLGEEWMIEGVIEHFDYQDKYTLKLPTAAIENRYQLRLKSDLGVWSHNFTATLVGPRDLSKFGRYSDHYVDRNQFPTETRGDELKDQRSPSFVTIDTSLGYKFWKTYQATIGVSNLLNTTQTSMGDSPSAWHWHFTHAHYDGLHTWGPNRGREIYFKLLGKF